MDIIVGVRTCTFWNNVKIHNALRVISRWLTVDDEKEDILIRALANGYETNLTPAEELQQYYKKIKSMQHFNIEGISYREGTLKGIEIAAKLFEVDLTNA